jgi:hypothetical protein
MRYILAPPSFWSRNATAQVRTLLNFGSRTNHPLFTALQTQKGNPLKHEKFWLARAEETLGTMSNRADLLVGRDCRNWVYGAENFKVHDLIDQHAQQ